MTILIPVEVTQAEQRVLDAAGRVVNSYKIGGGFTTPLDINLQALTAAVEAWREVMHTHSLDSDTNGFERSALWPGEETHSNEQSHPANAQRRRCPQASEAQSGSTEAQRQRAVRPGAA